MTPTLPLLHRLVLPFVALAALTGCPTFSFTEPQVDDFDRDGFTIEQGDCDDTDPRVRPEAVEDCNDEDDDCDGEVDEDVTERVFLLDLDEDGYGDDGSDPILSCTPVEGRVELGGDCDDGDAAINPEADELCDGIDNDCDAEVDEEVGLELYPDADADGYGAERAAPTTACEVLPGFTDNPDDCDDADPLVNPAAIEVCNDLDDDCDEEIDEGAEEQDWYPDRDEDGYGDSSGDPLVSCEPPEGYVLVGGDCDDLDELVSPGADELCNNEDDNCDGVADEGVEIPEWRPDVDGDGFGDQGAPATLSCAPLPDLVSTGGDCNDSDPAIRPGAPERCNGGDDNCDGAVDEGLTFSDWFSDGDGDGYGTGLPSRWCDRLEGTAELDGDCDDGDANVYPTAPELCNNADDDCDGVIDEDAVIIDWFPDLDGDGFGDPGGTPIPSCEAVEGYSTQATDCDDEDDSISPVGIEVCDDIDQDCDGVADNGLIFEDYFPDRDSDGFGDETAGISACAPVPGFIAQGGDCDDSTLSISPAVVEVCDGVDQDCTGVADDGLEFTDWWVDLDGDGYGDAAADALSSCNPVEGSAPLGGDCEDDNDRVNPGADESCNGLDDNCDGEADEGLTFSNWFPDTDSDGFGVSSGAINDCAPPEGFAAADGDCAPDDPSVFPGAPEICNEVDDNCNGAADDGVVYQDWYVDSDSDGFGDSGADAVSDCLEIPGSVTDNTDCDDSNAAINPESSESCNGLDDDCDSETDEGLLFFDYYPDSDSDGFGENGAPTSSCRPISGSILEDGDCDDSDPAVNPDALEVCNGVDDDCSGVSDDGLAFTDYYPDADSDGAGDSSASPTSSCQPIPGSVELAGDCNDADPTINPDASEVCDGVDNDCSGSPDDGLTFQDWWPDADGDSYGDQSASSESRCDTPPNSATNGNDCLDSDPLVFPGAPESCNEIDDDCDGVPDDGVATSDWYVDSDSDGFGDPESSPVTDCEVQPGRAPNNTDCNDGDAAINPAAIEICNDIDDDCAGGPDDGLATSSWYQDLDTDTWGAGSAVVDCAAPVGYVERDGDCNDSSSAINPGASEICNGLDDNCNGLDDDGLPFSDWWPDNDGDGYGSQLVGATSSCAEPPSSANNNGDCNDGDASINPAAGEPCDGIDNDCSGVPDDSGLCLELDCLDFADNDADGFIDCEDSDCAGEPGCIALSCSDEFLYNELGTPVTTGSTSGMGDDNGVGSCVVDSSPDWELAWVAPFTGRYHLDTYPSSYDTTLVLMSGDCSGTQLACNDDFTGRSEGYASGIAFDATAGDAFVIAMEGWNGDNGAYELNLVPWQCPDGTVPPASSDADALYRVTGNLNRTFNDLQGSCGGGGQDLTYSWTAPYSGTFTATTTSGSYTNDLDLLIYVLRGSCDGTEVGCDATRNDGSLEVTFSATAGEEFTIVIDNDNAQGSLNFTLDIY